MHRGQGRAWEPGEWCNAIEVTKWATRSHMIGRCAPLLQRLYDEAYAKLHEEYEAAHISTRPGKRKTSVKQKRAMCNAKRRCLTRNKRLCEDIQSAFSVVDTKNSRVPVSVKDRFPTPAWKTFLQVSRLLLNISFLAHLRTLLPSLMVLSAPVTEKTINLV
jgi:hypothetical protein